MLQFMGHKELDMTERLNNKNMKMSCEESDRKVG